MFNTKGIEVGNGVRLLRGDRLDSQGKDSRIWLGNNVQLADGVGVKVSRDNCCIDIGDRTSIEPYVVIHDPGNICWLGHKVSVLDGVTIGKGNVIGAGAVVTKDIPPDSIAVGVSAKVIGQRRKDEPHPNPQSLEIPVPIKEMLDV